MTEQINEFNRAQEVLFKLPLAVLAENEHRQISFANQYFCDLFAIPASPEQLTGMDCGGLAEQSKAYFKEPNLFLDYVNQAISVHNPIHDVELELIDGRHLSATYVPYFKENIFAGHIWTYKEITLRKAAEAELRKSEQRYKTVVNHLQEIIFRLDSSGKITFLNPAWEKITGHTVKDTIGKKIVQFADKQYKQIIEESISNLFSGAKSEERGLIKIINKELEDVYLQVYGSTIILEDGQTGIWGTLTNVTEKKNAEIELLKSIEKERELFELKSRFVNMVSHEIRTPMAGILSSVELLELISNGDPVHVKPKSQKHFDRIKSQIKRITELMNDVLQLGKIEAGKVVFNPKMNNVLQVTNELIDDNFHPDEIGRKIDVEITGLQRLCKVDVDLFKHIISNLLSNAIKYSANKPDPCIKLIFKEMCLEVEVTDYGIGIPAKEQKTLFSAFNRASNTHNIEGTGLGLVVIKHFVDIHEGKISFKSTENVGSTFKVSLPG